MQTSSYLKIASYSKWKRFQRICDETQVCSIFPVLICTTITFLFVILFFWFWIIYQKFKQNFIWNLYNKINRKIGFLLVCLILLVCILLCFQNFGNKLRFKYLSQLFWECV